jgi:hypothetical protein
MTMAVNLETVRQWLDTIHGRSAGHVWIGGHDTGFVGRTFDTTDPEWVEQAAGYVAQMEQRRSQGTYLRCTSLRRVPDKRGSAADSLTLPCLWADLDIAGPRHAAQQLPPDEASARKVVDSSGLPEPTAWVRTGGGLSAWWLLNPVHTIGDDLDHIKDLSVRWQDTLAYAAGRLGWHHDTAVKDLARIMRIPGTINRKPNVEPVPCELLEATGATYTLLALTGHLEAAEKARPAPAPIRTPGDRVQPAAGNLRPGDDFNLRADMMRDVLAPAGWTYDHADNEYVYVVRPGKQRGQGHSATISKGDDRLWVFTDSVPELPPCDQSNGPYTKFAAYAALFHRGNHSAAARELHNCGYGTSSRPARALYAVNGTAARVIAEPPPDLDREAQWEATIAEAEKRRSAAVNPGPDPGTAHREEILRGLHPDAEQAARAWVDPDPLGGEGDPPAPFPVDALPDPLRDFVEAVAASKQVPVDMVALTTLAGLSTAALNRCWISGGNGWVEPLTLWALSVMESASRKSPVMRDVATPFYAIERRARRQHEKAAAKREDLLAVAEQRKKRIVADLAKASGNKRRELEAELEAARHEIQDLAPKPVPRQLVDDITPEALGQVMAANDGHIGMLSAEGGVFGMLAGRYTNGQSNLDLFLKSFDGEPYRSDRVGRGMVAIDQPALAMALAVQPDVLAETQKTPAMRERGLMGRFLYAVPESTVGTRSVQAPAMPDEVTHRWNELVVSITCMPVRDPEQPRPTLNLHPDALGHHHDFRQTIEPRLHPLSGDLAFMADWAGKLAGKVLRIAGLLHLADGRALREPVDLATMAAAVEIGEWALTHAVHVYGGWRAPEQNVTAVRTLEWLQRARPETFTVRDTWQALRGQAWCTSTEAVKDTLVLLVRAGWLTTVQRLMADGKRRLREGSFIPHPSLFRESP